MSPLTVSLFLTITSTLLVCSSAAPSGSTISFPGDVADSQLADTAPRLHSRSGAGRRPYPRHGGRRDIYFPREEDTARPPVVPDSHPDRHGGQSTGPEAKVDEAGVILDKPRPHVRPDHPPDHPKGRPDHPQGKPHHPAVTPDHPATRPGHETGRRPVVVPDSPPRRPGSTHSDQPHTPDCPVRQPEAPERPFSGGSGSGSTSSSGSGGGSSSGSISGGGGSSSSSASSGTGGGSSSSSTSGGGSGSSSGTHGTGGSGSGSSSTRVHFPDDNGDDEPLPLPLPIVSCGGELFHGYDNDTDSCRKLWTNCSEPGTWFVVHPETGEAGCQPRPCPDGEDLFDGKCWLTSGNHSGPCAEGMHAFRDQFGHAYCDCQPLQVYWPPEHRCYPVYKRGPCAEGHHLVVSDVLRRGVCQPTPCLDGEVLWADPESNDPCRCYSVPEFREDDPCLPGGQLKIDPYTLQVECQHHALHAVFDPPQVRCPAGSYLDFSGECREELVQEFRSSFHVQVGGAERAPSTVRCPAGIAKTVEVQYGNEAVLIRDQPPATGSSSTKDRPATGSSSTKDRPATGSSSTKDRPAVGRPSPSVSRPATTEVGRQRLAKDE